MAITSLIAIFFIILPVIVFNRFYYRKAFSKQFNLKSFFQSIVTYIIPAIIIQLLFGYMYSTFWKEVNFITVINDILKGFESNKIFNFSDDSELKEFLKYNVFLWGLTGFLGALLGATVVKFKLDKKFKLFRFKNEWEYLFKGGVLDYKQNKSAKNGSDRAVPILTYVDIWTCNKK